MVRKEGKKSISTMWIFCEGEKTKDHISDAIKFSKQIISMHENDGVEIISRESNPSTLVHRLIEQIYDFDE